VTVVAFWNVVVLGLPFHCTVDVVTKLVPFTVRVNAIPPARALDGFNPFNVGTGLLTVNVEPFDVPPPGAGLNTVTVALPPVAISAGSHLRLDLIRTHEIRRPR
jgi:hypothetical protein